MKQGPYAGDADKTHFVDIRAAQVSTDQGFILFAQASLDPRTEPWHGLLERDADAPLRRAYLPDLLQRLARAQPEHPLLAVFLPYLEDNLEHLRTAPTIGGSYRVDARMVRISCDRPGNKPPDIGDAVL